MATRNPAYALLGAAALVVGTNGVVLFSNLARGVYRPEADSIGIPLFECVVVCVIVLAFGLLGNALRGEAIWRRLVAGFFNGLAVVVCLASVLQWAIPNHYPIAVAYLLLALALVAPPPRKPSPPGGPEGSSPA